LSILAISVEAVEALTAAGYVILPAAEVEERERAARGKALEEAAAVADRHARDTSGGRT